MTSTLIIVKTDKQTTVTLFFVNCFIISHGSGFRDNQTLPQSFHKTIEIRILIKYS